MTMRRESRLMLINQEPITKILKKKAKRKYKIVINKIICNRKIVILEACAPILNIVVRHWN